jgi:hypothetical protein
VVCRDDKTYYLYEEGLAVPDAENVELVRASNIEAMPPGIRFKIKWPEYIQPFIGEAETTQDEAGKPFTSKEAAERYEIHRLLRDFFMEEVLQGVKAIV